MIFCAGGEFHLSRGSASREGASRGRSQERMRTHETGSGVVPLPALTARDGRKRLKRRALRAARDRRTIVIRAAGPVLMHGIGAEGTMARRRAMGPTALIGIRGTRRIVVHARELGHALPIVAGIGGVLGGVEMLLRGPGVGAGPQALDKALGLGDLRAGDARCSGLGLGMGKGRGREQEGGGNGGGNYTHDSLSPGSASGDPKPLTLGRAGAGFMEGLRLNFDDLRGQTNR